MLEDLHEKNSYEVLEQTTEDRSAWRDCMKVPKTCYTAEN